MFLSEVLQKNNIIINCQSSNRWDLIDEVLNLAVKNKDILAEDKETVKNILVERERTMSTGIGNEVAIPHCKTVKVDKIMAYMAINKKGMNFEAIDNKLVKIAIFLLVPQNKLAQYIKILANIAKIMNREDLRAKILSFKTVTSIIKTTKEFEELK